MNPIQQNWINFKNHFCTVHRELEETGEWTIEDAVFHQANLVNYIVSHMFGLPYPYPPLVCQEPTYAPTTTPIPNYAPMMAPIVQPTPEANAATNAISAFIVQLLTSMQQMQQLMVQMQANQGGGGGQNNNCNTRRPPTRQEATKPRQGQPHKILPDFATMYFWTHGKNAHGGAACNKKAPKRQDTATFYHKRNGSTYGCT